MTQAQEETGCGQRGSPAHEMKSMAQERGGGAKPHEGNIEKEESLMSCFGGPSMCQVPFPTPGKESRVRLLFTTV